MCMISTYRQPVKARTGFYRALILLETVDSGGCNLKCFCRRFVSSAHVLLLVLLNSCSFAAHTSAEH